MTQKTILPYYSKNCAFTCKTILSVRLSRLEGAFSMEDLRCFEIRRFLSASRRGNVSRMSEVCSGSSQGRISISSLSLELISYSIQRLSREIFQHLQPPNISQFWTSRNLLPNQNLASITTFSQKSKFTSCCSTKMNYKDRQLKYFKSCRAQSFQPQKPTA